MPANVDAMIRAAVDAIRNGKKTDARTLLEKAIELDEYNEGAWLWLSGVVETPDEQKTCLDNVLIINPNNEKAKAGLKALGFTPSAPPPPTASTAPAFTPAFDIDNEEDLFGDVSFDTDTSPSLNDWDAPIATSSASSTPVASQASADQYDRWLSDLNIGGKPGSSPSESGGLFGDVNEDDFFSDATPATAAPVKNDPFGQNPFGDDPFGDDPFGNTAGYDEDEYDEPEEIENSSYAMEVDDHSFEDIISQPANESFEDLLSDNLLGDVETHSKRTSPENQKAPEELFAQIPDEIEPGRLPGTDESYPASVGIGLAIAVVLNVGAILLLVSRLMG